MSYPTTTSGLPEDISNYNGISRHLALGRILHFEALMRRRLGEVRPQRYVRLHNYYANQNLPADNVDQPLLINYVKPIVDKHTSYLWGQYKEKLVGIRVVPINKDSMDEASLAEANLLAQKIKRYLDTVYDYNQGNTTLWQASKNGCLYGDSVLYVRYNEYTRLPVWEALLPEYFHAMWNIADMSTLTEVLIAYPIDRSLALEQFGTTGNDHFIGYQAVNPHYLPGIGILWQRWSPTSFQLWVDDVMRINIPNPYMPWDSDGNLYPGLLPFVHIPNMQGGSEFWGYGDAESVLYLNDEINRRLADTGDIVSNHAHPIITLQKFSGDVNDLPVGPDSVWDLGREGVAERLEGRGVHPQVMDYIEKIEEVMMETANMPKAAFGHQKGGTSHQSGIATAMALMPVVERSKEKRIRWTHGLRRLWRMTLYVMSVRDPMMLEQYGFTYNDTLQFNIEPVWADILPKDRLELVNENVARGANMQISIPTALASYGEEDVLSEYNKIKADASLKATLAAPATPDAAGGTGGKNSDTGTGGSPSIPGSIGGSLSKPGGQIKSPELTQSDSVSLSSTP
jgi:hypothetical protein